MSEVLTQVENVPEAPISTSDDVVGAGINLKNLQILNYLGLKDEMFNSSIMEKVDFLGKNCELEELMHLDWKLGQDPTMSKLDKVYSFLKLDMMSRKKKDELSMIDEAKNRMLK